MFRRAVALILVGALSLSQLSHAAQSVEPVSSPEKPENWIGHEAIQLFEVWGSPDRSYPIEDGGAILIYKKGRKIGVVDSGPYDALSRKQGVRIQDEIQFRTDRFNRILEFRCLSEKSIVSKGAWFWGGFAVGTFSAFAMMILILTGLSSSEAVTVLP